MKQKKMVVFFLSVFSLLMVACGGEELGMETEETEINVVASFYPMYEFASQVGGDRAEVTLMVDGGADPHSYEPSAQDIGQVSEADVFVYSSIEMEYWANSLLDTIENDDLIVAQAIEGIDDVYEAVHSHEEESHSETVATDAPAPYAEETPTEIDLMGVAGHYHTGDQITLLAQYEEAEEFIWSVQYSGEDWQEVEELTTERFEYEATGEDFFVQGVALDDEGNEQAATEVTLIHIDDHDDLDPHIWLDPVLAQEQVLFIRDAFIEADPEGEDIYMENADAFVDRLQELHEAYEEALSEAENRVFVVQHEAFGYLANRYQLEQIAIGGLSTEVEPSPSRIAEIGQLVEETEVPVIYYQHGADSSIAQTVANETGTDTAVLHDLETLSQELQENDLGYIEAMEENLEALQMSIH